MKILNNPRMSDRSSTIGRTETIKLCAMIILSLPIISANVAAQDYYSSDATRAKNLQEEMGSQKNNGSGSFFGSSTRTGDEPVRKIDFFVCNYSGRNNISVAYSARAFRNERVKGWKNVRKGKCKLVLARQTHVKFYAFSGKATWSGKNLLWEDEPLTWVDPYALCVDPKKGFDVAADLEACPDGYTRVRFHFANVESRDEDKDGRYFLNLRD